MQQDGNSHPPGVLELFGIAPDNPALLAIQARLARDRANSTQRPNGTVLSTSTTGNIIRPVESWQVDPLLTMAPNPTGYLAPTVPGPRPHAPGASSAGGGGWSDAGLTTAVNVQGLPEGAAAPNSQHFSAVVASSAAASGLDPNLLKLGHMVAWQLLSQPHTTAGGAAGGAAGSIGAPEHLNMPCPVPTSRSAMRNQGPTKSPQQQMVLQQISQQPQRDHSLPWPFGILPTPPPPPPQQQQQVLLRQQQLPAEYPAWDPQWQGSAYPAAVPVEAPGDASAVSFVPDSTLLGAGAAAPSAALPPTPAAWHRSSASDGSMPAACDDMGVSTSLGPIPTAATEARLQFEPQTSEGITAGLVQPAAAGAGSRPHPWGAPLHFTDPQQHPQPMVMSLGQQVSGSNCLAGGISSSCSSMEGVHGNSCPMAGSAMTCGPDMNMHYQPCPTSNAMKGLQDAGAAQHQTVSQTGPGSGTASTLIGPSAASADGAIRPKPAAAKTGQATVEQLSEGIMQQHADVNADLVRLLVRLASEARGHGFDVYVSRALTEATRLQSTPGQEAQGAALFRWLQQQPDVQHVLQDRALSAALAAGGVTRPLEAPPAAAPHQPGVSPDGLCCHDGGQAVLLQVGSPATTSKQEGACVIDLTTDDLDVNASRAALLPCTHAAKRHVGLGGSGTGAVHTVVPAAFDLGAAAGGHAAAPDVPDGVALSGQQQMMTADTPAAAGCAQTHAPAFVPGSTTSSRPGIISSGRMQCSADTSTDCVEAKVPQPTSKSHVPAAERPLLPPAAAADCSLKQPGGCGTAGCQPSGPSQSSRQSNPTATALAAPTGPDGSSLLGASGQQPPAAGSPLHGRASQFSWDNKRCQQVQRMLWPSTYERLVELLQCATAAPDRGYTWLSDQVTAWSKELKQKPGGEQQYTKVLQFLVACPQYEAWLKGSIAKCSSGAQEGLDKSAAAAGAPSEPLCCSLMASEGTQVIATAQQQLTGAGQVQQMAKQQQQQQPQAVASTAAQDGHHGAEGAVGQHKEHMGQLGYYAAMLRHSEAGSNTSCVTATGTIPTAQHTPAACGAARSAGVASTAATRELKRAGVQLLLGEQPAKVSRTTNTSPHTPGDTFAAGEVLSGEHVCNQQQQQHRASEQQQQAALQQSEIAAAATSSLHGQVLVPVNSGAAGCSNASEVPTTLLNYRGPVLFL